MLTLIFSLEMSADAIVQRYVSNLAQIEATHSQNLLNEQKRLNQNNVSRIHAQILPTKLEQVKPLTSLKTAFEQWQVWNQAIEVANGYKNLTALFINMLNFQKV